MLSKLGFRFDPGELESWEVEAYNTIENQILRLEKEAEKKHTRK